MCLNTRKYMSILSPNSSEFYGEFNVLDIKKELNGIRITYFLSEPHRYKE